jgi:hypothetical protein
LIYVNGVLVEDTAAGFVSGLTLTVTNGAGYLPHGGNIALTFNTPLGGTPATGYMTVSSSTTIPGHIRSVTLTSGGSGYTAADPPVITIPAPTDTTVPQTNAVITFTYQSLGNYLPSTSGGVPSLAGAASAGWNGGGMSELIYNLPHGTYGSGNANSTFGIGDQAGTGEIGLTGYLGDVVIYGEALSTAGRQALENAEGAKFITGATESFSISTSIGNGTIVGPATVVQGYSATYTFLPTIAYAINGVTVDGVSVGVVTSYTLNNVSANHSIVVSTVAVPPQNITVTYGAGGTITTNGTIMPTGANWANITGGSSPAFAIAVNPGFALGVVKADGVTIPNATISGAGGVYTFANIGGNGSGPGHTLTVTFVALPSGPGIASASVAGAVPESEYLFFSVDTASLPQLPTFTVPTPITNWPMFYSSQGVTNMIQGASGGTPALAKTFTDASGVVWEQNIEGEGPTSTGYQFYPGAVGATTGTSLANSGATIVTVVSPIENGVGAGDPWHSIVDVFFGCVELSVNPGSGLIQAIVDNDKGGYDGTASPVATSTYAIPSGSNTVLSLVVQPNGSFAVYANTVLVITNAGLGPLYMTAGNQGFTFANNIQIGSDGPDTWSCFNGLIGNTYFWTTALTTTERTNLEAALMTEFHAVVPPNFNWVGPNNGNWSDVNNWSNTVPFAVNTVPGTGGSQTPVFSFAGAGQTVNLDTPESVAGLIFSTNTVIDSPAGNILTLNNGTADPTITVSSNGASATINAVLSLSQGLNVVGPGTLTLATNVTLGATINGYVEIAQNASSTASVVQTGGTLTTFSIAQSWASGNGPGVMLGGADNSATSASYSLSGGTLITPNIGCVTENFGVTPNVLVPPSTRGATAILYLNGGVLQASDNDSVDANALAEGSAHLIFNTTHTYVQTGGAIIDTVGYSDSIAVPLEHYPGGPGLDGGLIKLGAGTLSNLTTVTYTGPTVVSNGILACETLTSLGGNSVTIVPGAKLQLDYTGTIEVYALTTNGTSVPPGVYGSTASGAAHADDTDFVPGSKGTLTVLGTITTGETPKFTSTAFTGSAGNGNLVLSGTGGIAGGTFLVVGSTNVAAPLADWVTLAQGTFTGAGFSVSIPVTTALPQEFIRVVVP